MKAAATASWFGQCHSFELCAAVCRFMNCRLLGAGFRIVPWRPYPAELLGLRVQVA